MTESLADISLARELIGYEPSVAFEEGLERTIDWIVEQSLALRRGPSGAGAGRTTSPSTRPGASLYYGPNRDYMGGAEVQATMLAHALKAKGLRVAHVVYPVPEPRRVDASSPTLVERSDWQGHRRLGQLAETGAIWRGLQRADAEAYIVRGSGGHVLAASSFCRARRRRFVFSSSSELDFDFARPDRNPGCFRSTRPASASPPGWPSRPSGSASWPCAPSRTAIPS